jgi:uncharacterized protein YjbJ (UPF0337 family)
MAHDKEDRELEKDGLINSVKGKATEAKGKIKDAAGGLTGNTGLQAEGKVDQLGGKIRNAVGNAERKLAKQDSETDDDIDRDANRGT